MEPADKTLVGNQLTPLQEVAYLELNLQALVCLEHSPQLPLQVLVVYLVEVAPNRHNLSLYSDLVAFNLLQKLLLRVCSGLLLLDNNLHQAVVSSEAVLKPPSSEEDKGPNPQLSLEDKLQQPKHPGSKQCSVLQANKYQVASLPPPLRSVPMPTSLSWLILTAIKRSSWKRSLPLIMPRTSS